MKQVLFIAAENDALKNAKVGGVADVVRDLPAALESLGWSVTVAIPAYGLLHKAKRAKQIQTMDVQYRGVAERVDVWEVPGCYDTVTNLVFDHALFAAYAPATEPEIAIAVVVEHAGQGGGRVAAPIAQQVLARFFEKRAERLEEEAAE